MYWTGAANTCGNYSSNQMIGISINIAKKLHCMGCCTNRSSLPAAFPLMINIQAAAPYGCSICIECLLAFSAEDLNSAQSVYSVFLLELYSCTCTLLAPSRYAEWHWPKYQGNILFLSALLLLIARPRNKNLERRPLQYSCLSGNTHTTADPV